MKMAIRLVALSAILTTFLSTQDTAQHQIEAKLRLCDLATGTSTDGTFETVRNGDFSAGIRCWAVPQLTAGSNTTATPFAGRKGDKKDIGGHMIPTGINSTTAFLAQPLYFPQTVTKVEIEFDYKLFAQNPQLAAFDKFAATLGVNNATGKVTPLLTLKEHTLDNLPGNGWQKCTHTCTKSEIATIAKYAKQQFPFVINVGLSANLVEVYLDNVSVKVTGTRTTPKIAGRLAWAEHDKTSMRIVTGAPDGSSREVCAHIGAVISPVCYGLDWSPDGTALCFASNHEIGFSWFATDLYELSAGGIKRLTNGPQVSELNKKKDKTGKVKVRVKNTTKKAFTALGVWIQGSLNVRMVSVSALSGGQDEVEVIFDNVVDLGDGVLQNVILRVGGKSEFTTANVDVKVGETVDAGTASLTGLIKLNASAPTYRFDGKKIAFSVGHLLNTIPASGGGTDLDGLSGTSGYQPAHSPKDGQLLYLDRDSQVMLKTSYTAKPQLIMKPTLTTWPTSMAWFPDNSGFVFTSMSGSSTNLYVYGFEQKRSAAISDVYNETIGSPTLSPDGKWVAYVRAYGDTAELWVAQVGHIGNTWRIKTKGNVSQVAWSR